MKLALKIDVDTLRGTREGVPKLIDMLQRHRVGATFLFSVGPDHTGRALRRAFRPGFASKVKRTSVVSHYGLRTLLYGTLLPGPDIGRSAGGVMRRARDAGFETGVHCYDHVRWQDHVADADAAWTEAEMMRAIDSYSAIFGELPRTHGAAGWQMNVHGLRLMDRLGFDYGSDGRGHSPHLPVWTTEAFRCPQLPTTLPTLDELIGTAEITADNVATHLLGRTAGMRSDHVFTLHAELEGMKLAPVLEQLLVGWKSQGYSLVSTRALYESVKPAALPRFEVGWGSVSGRTGTLLVQKRRIPGPVDNSDGDVV